MPIRADRPCRLRVLRLSRPVRTQDSIFTPGRSVWSKDVRDDLYQRFVMHPDESKASFLEEYEGQLRGAPAGTIQLAPEALRTYVLTAQLPPLPESAVAPG